MSSRLNEQLAIIATIDPTAAATGTVTSDTIDLKYWGKVLFVLAVGTVAATGTVDMTINSGTATGTITTSVTDITQLTAADDNKQVLVEINDASVSGRYINCVTKQGTANSNISVVALGGACRYQSAADHDLASVDEIVSN